jgi:hypothetical protein
MVAVIQILLGGTLAIVGGILGAHYHACLAARAETRARFRAIYHALLSAASASRTYARTPLDDALLDDGGLASWWLRRQERELEELSDSFHEARRHANWLDFETDLRSIEGRLRFSTLDWTFADVRRAHARLLDAPAVAVFDELLAATQALDASADDLARAIRQHMLELELSMPRFSPRRAPLHTTTQPRSRRRRRARQRGALLPLSERQ